MNKSVYVGLSTLEIVRIVMHGFWYDNIELKQGEQLKLCYLDTDSFIVYTKTAHFTQTLHKMLKLDLILKIAN